MSNNRITIKNVPSGDLDLSRYEKIPMDLNFSPLREYFEGIHLLGYKTGDVESSTSTTGRTMPVGIPGSSESISHDQKKRHHKRRRKPVAHTFPDDGLEAVMKRRLRQQNEKAKSNQNFIVGSLQEKPPVPWPTALITTADSKRNQRLANRQTVNWPLLPQRRDYFIEEDIFNMDDDFYNSSDCDESDNFSMK